MDNLESQIRTLIRKFPMSCPSCGSETISIEKEVDTDVGVMDEMICSDCEHQFIMVSSVHTFFVGKDS